MKIRISLLFAITLFISCNRAGISTEEKYFRWINNPDNHLFATKAIDGVSYTVKYLPPEFLAYKELKGTKYNKKDRDSLIKIYAGNRTFLLSFGPEASNNKDPKTDVIYKGLSNKEDYEKRLVNLNFNLKEFIQLKTGDNTYSPVLHTFENSYGIAPQKNIYLVFAPDKHNNNDLMQSEELDFVFDDQIYINGILHFSFKKEDLDNIPYIRFWDNN